MAEREAGAMTAWWERSDATILGVRYLSLLYTCFFFISPYYDHSLAKWMWFAAFYIAFLTLYFTIPKATGRTRIALFVLFFLLGEVYFPFNVSASGAFVFPVVMIAYVVRPKVFVRVLIGQIAVVALETWLFHLPMWAGAMGVFFVLAIGGSNLFYAQQQRATELLRKANREIEQLAKTAERERIARDLHDLLGHTLTVIALKSELAHRVVDADAGRAKTEMIEVEETARKALAEVREAVLGYRSEGLPAEIVRARRTLTSAGVEMESSIAEVVLTPGQNDVLCLALREAVTNIVRHARATRCVVGLAVNAETIVFSVEDDGVGCAGKENNGLRGMRERAAALGGELVVGSAAGSGTRVEIRVPHDRRA